MSQFMVGTAGHIDHGKTTLIKALSGKNTDRLKEEQKRGISIVNGYSFIESGEHRISIIDVPGHERFIKNMLAGMTAINYVLFVVAADEGVMPQTREHFEIVRLLGIKHGIFLITKADMVDREMIELVELDIEDMISGTPYESWEKMAISAYQEDQVAELRSIITDFFDEYQEPSLYAPRYFIDRVFKSKGIGEIVTGSLEENSLSIDDRLMSYPGETLFRLRSMESHDASLERAEKNTRVALRLTGEGKDLERGDVLSYPDAYFLGDHLIAKLHVLEDKEDRIRNNAEYKCYFGTKELTCKLIQLGSGYVELMLDDKTLLYHGQRAILRQLSPVMTLAGIEVIDANPPQGRQSKRDYAKALNEGDYHTLIFDKYPEGMTREDLQKEWVRVVQEDELSGFKRIGQRYLPEETYRARLDEVIGTLEAYFDEHPLATTMDREILLQQLQISDRSFFDSLLKDLQAEGLIETLKHKISLSNRRVTLTDDEEKRVKDILEEFKGYGLEPPSTAEVLKGYTKRDQGLLQYLIDIGEIITINDDINLKNEFVICVENDIINLINTQGYLEIADLRDKYQLSRKYIVPLLEYFDRVGVTKRDGNRRMLTKEYNHG